MARFLAALLLLLPAPALADAISARPEAVAVTIYRDGSMTSQDLAQLGADDTHGLALVVETRTVDLPAGRTRVRFEGVADGIIPESAAVTGLPGAIVERNFDYDLLGPGSILQRFVGETVKVVRTNPRTGRAVEETAILRSGPDGVALDFSGRIEALRCSGGAEKLVFDQVPADLADRPTLSVVASAPAPGRYTVQVSYLTVRLDWAADYIARIGPDGTTLALSGWITLANRSGMSFSNAPTSVVAGNLSRVEVVLPDVTTPHLNLRCWPMGTTHSGWYRPVNGEPMPPPAPPMVMGGMMDKSASTVSEMVVTGAKIAVESQLGDYKQYTLPEPTTVAARQTKQVMFLTQPVVKFETVYGYSVQPNDDGHIEDEGDPVASNIVLRFDNKLDRGLGRALPAGMMHVMLSDGVRQQFAGEYRVERDVPVGEPFEVKIGRTSDVTVTPDVVDRITTRRHGRDHLHVEMQVRITNAKSAPALVEIRETRTGTSSFKVTAESAGHGLKAGDPLWRIPIPANTDRTFTYTVEYDVAD